MTTEEFISLNADADVRRLALSNAGRKDIDLTYALEQIAGRQKAKAKLPRWAAADGSFAKLCAKNISGYNIKHLSQYTSCFVFFRILVAQRVNLF